MGGGGVRRAEVCLGEGLQNGEREPSLTDFLAWDKGPLALTTGQARSGVTRMTLHTPVHNRA